ncbi:MAG: UvrD-helicase domain-containing protein [Candidatus Omnitrophica bacterium]|nr:UvrD-helicase domain-containing protein [Candidatus Omnitrophota bacterium]
MDNKDPASHISEIIFVEASAGSGKTFALAKRYLELLINSQTAPEHIPLRNILAITFTNKATVEMKERILEFLKRIAFNLFNNPDQEREIFSSLALEKSFAQDRARRIMDKLIEHYNFFQVQTIDSFVNAILLGSALNIDRSSSFQIKTSYSRYLAYCLDLVIEEASRNDQVYDFFEEFLEHYLLVQNATGWFPKEDILKLIESLFRLTNKYGWFFLIQPGKGSDVIAQKKHIYAQIENLSQNFPEGLNAARANSILSFLKKNVPIFDTADIPSSFASSNIPMNKKKDAPDRISKQWAKINKELREMLEMDAKIFYNPYLKLLTLIFSFFQMVSKKEDILFLEELNHKARLLFDEEHVTVAELYYRLATRFRHYLIDEFQDTSVLQWHNLETMVAEALANGGTLFCVGDKKQAIYRFRGGEAELFEQVKKSFSHYYVKPRYLCENWRSQKTIVDFNNRIFSRENLKIALSVPDVSEKLGESSSRLEQILDVFKDTAQRSREENTGGYVYVERIDAKNKEERDKIMQPKILNLLNSLIQDSRFKYEDIALLAKDNEEVELITSWLLSAGLPVESEKTLNVLENPLIKEVTSFLRFLHKPVDDLSFASFIMGEIFSKASNISTTEITDFIFKLHKEKKVRADFSLYRIFREHYKEIWEKYIEEFFKNVGFISHYELTASFFERFSVYEKFPRAQGFFMKFLELIKKAEDEYPGLGEFLAYLKDARPEDLYVSVTAPLSLKVLTIHKAKGLEFPVVIIPFLRMEVEPETVGKGTSSYVVEAPRSLVRITKKHREFSQELAQIYYDNYRKACIDELNALYVALTRPKYELYVFIPERSDNEKNNVRFIIPEEIKELGQKITYAQKTKADNPLMQISPSTYKDWINSIKEEFGSINTISNRKEIIDGIVLHAILSKITNCIDGDFEEIFKGALVFAKNKFTNIDKWPAYQAEVLASLHKEEMHDIFYVKDGQVFCEKELVNNFGDLKRIDRLIVKNSQVWIVDYKSSAKEKEASLAQVIEYMRIIGEIYPGKKARGFLVYLDEAKIEEVKDNG